MASSIFRSLRKSTVLFGSSSVKLSSPASLLKTSSCRCSASLPKTSICRCSAGQKLGHSHGYSSAVQSEGEERERRKGKGGGGRRREEEDEEEEEEEEVPTEGISRPMSQILKQLNKRIPDSLITLRNEDGFSIKYIPWHVVNRIMNLHAPEWSGEVRSITYSPDGKSVSVVYRVTLHGTDAEIFRESTGTAALDDKGYGDAVQKAEAMAFRRACARLGLGLYLYHEDMS